jgi:hypothetical protein
VDAKTGAMGFLELPRIQIGGARCDLAGVGKNRCIEVGESRTAHFRIEGLHVVVVIAIGVVAPQRVLPSQARHQIEGHDVAARRVGEDLAPAQDEDPSLR